MPAEQTFHIKIKEEYKTEMETVGPFTPRKIVFCETSCFSLFHLDIYIFEYSQIRNEIDR